jgi:hypothetical protein
LLLIHVLAVGVGVMWLRSTDRLDRARLQQAVDIFKVTLADEKVAEEAAVEQAAVDATQADRDAWLQTVSAGPQSMNDRLENQQEADELRAERVRKLESDLESLRRQLDISRRELERERAALERERADLEAAATRTRDQLKDEDFQKALSLYQRVRPKQAKDMFKALMEQGETDQVVTYLSAMQEKKASDIIKEFKGDDEIAMATDLVERMRQREAIHDPQTNTAATAPGNAGGAS